MNLSDCFQNHLGKLSLNRSVVSVYLDCRSNNVSIVTVLNTLKGKIFTGNL